MHKKLTPVQRLKRIAYKNGISAQGYDAPEISKVLLRNRQVSEDDKRRVREIMEEWAKIENSRGDKT